MKNRTNEMDRTDPSCLFDRRKALKVGAGAALAAAWPGCLSAAAANPAKLVWGNLLHLSLNLWWDWDNPGTREMNKNYSPVLRFDDHLWDELLPAMAGAGMNLLVIDLGDGVQYRSHPEIAVKNAWTIERLQAELARLRKAGLEPIPKLNFSTTHNAWLGPYRHMVSSDKYYAVCQELIAEVCALFDKPRFFHLGMDEEFAGIQDDYQYVVVRKRDLWWHDFLLLVAEVEKHGVRPWIWSDVFADHRDEFLKRMPKTVVQSNWYYGLDFSDKNASVQLYRLLAAGGYDQIPTGSNWNAPLSENFPRLVEYCAKVIPPERLLGFLQTSWQPTLPAWRSSHLAAIALAKAARQKLTEKR
jgi:hypothetical protein